MSLRTTTCGVPHHGLQTRATGEEREVHVFSRLAGVFIVVVGLAASAVRADAPVSALATPAALSAWSDTADDTVIQYFEDSTTDTRSALQPPAGLMAALSPDERSLLTASPPETSTTTSDTAFPLAVGRLRGRIQQALILGLNDAVKAGNVELARAWRAEIKQPAGVSGIDGEKLLQNLPTGQPQLDEAARTLVREAITWQTARVRELFADACRNATHPDTPLPGRLIEALGEAARLADLPASLRADAGLTGAPLLDAGAINQRLLALQQTPWESVQPPLADFRQRVETHLPSLLSDSERQRHERMLLKLINIIPAEYRSGVVEGKVTVPLEYREAVTFTAQAREFADELAPLWLAENSGKYAAPLQQLEHALADADTAIAAKVDVSDLQTILKPANNILTDTFDISLHRNGTTAEIVDEVMLETRTLLGQSLAAADGGDWAGAQNLRLEAYTNYDPELEARLMPRDPNLAMQIEQLLLDGIDKPGVKLLLDQHNAGPELEAAYGRVYTALDTAAALLKSSISPTAAALSAGSIVMREGLEGLLVTVAILAGLRGEENAQRRRLFWLGIAASMAATAVTWILSQTLITSLRNYGEVIEAVTGILAIVVLLLITNWLFQQVYWKQWVTSLKAQAAGENKWQLVSAGFLVGYREGFETVLFLQSIVLDASGRAVSVGVAVGCILLLALGIAVLQIGLKLPYYKILLITAVMIGAVLISFVGGTVRSAQTVGWLPVHRLTSSSWSAWMGTWAGLYNTVESTGGQVLAIVSVIGTWQVSRWQSKRKVARRRAQFATQRSVASCAPAQPCETVRNLGLPACDRDAADCCSTADDATAARPVVESQPVEVRLPPRPRPRLEPEPEPLREPAAVE